MLDELLDARSEVGHRACTWRHAAVCALALTYEAAMELDAIGASHSTRLSVAARAGTVPPTVLLCRPCCNSRLLTRHVARRSVRPGKRRCCRTAGRPALIAQAHNTVAQRRRRLPLHFRFYNCNFESRAAIFASLSRTSCSSLSTLVSRISFVSRSSRISASRSATSEDAALGTDVRRGGAGAAWRAHRACQRPCDEVQAPQRRTRLCHLC